MGAGAGVSIPEGVRKTSDEALKKVVNGMSKKAFDRLRTALKAQEQEIAAVPGANARDRVDYNSEETLWKALRTGDVLLIRASWLKKLAREEGILPRRQDCPLEAFISVDELQEMHNASSAMPKAAEQKRVPIIAVSHFWREKGHPDKNGVTLRIIGQALENQGKKYAEYGLTEMGVFFDWCSLYQEPREGDQLDSFKRSLKFINLWYGHSLTTVFLVTDQPDGVIPYHERGWTTFECMLSYLTKLVDQWNVWPQVIDLGPEQVGRPPPAEPDAFCEGHILGEKKFTNGADRELVARKFREACEDIFTSVTELDYDELGWNDDDFKGISVLLQYCQNLQRLDLNQNAITYVPDTICHAKALETLSLAGTKIIILPDSIFKLQALQGLNLGRTGLITLSESIGNFQELMELDLADTAITALPDSVGKLQALECLSLSGTKITTLPDSIGELEALETLSLDCCKNLTALPDSIGQLQGLQTLDLRATDLTKEQKEAAQRMLPECRVVF